MNKNNMNCSDVIIVKNIIKQLSVISEISSKMYYHGELIDCVFSLNEPASSNEISNIELLLKTKLIEEHQELLLLTNGITMSHYAKIYSIAEIISMKSIYDFYPQNMIPIGECCNSEVHILTDINERSRENMYIIDCIGDDYFSSINCSFITFLDRFIMSYGSPFWDWGKRLTDIPKII